MTNQNAISLKEGFRILNILDKHISTLSIYLSNKSNAVKVEEHHLKSKSNFEVVDEIIDQTIERLYPCSITDISYLILQLTNQKLELSLAIENAKKDLFLDWKENGENLTLDTGVSYCKKIRELSNNLKYLLDIKSSESKSQGSSYKFNVAGDQVKYFYDIEKKVTLDFDKNVVNDLYKKLLQKTDSISTQIELAMLKEIVKFTPIYDIHSSTSEIVDEYMINRDK